MCLVLRFIRREVRDNHTLLPKILPWSQMERTTRLEFRDRLAHEVPEIELELV